MIEEQPILLPLYRLISPNKSRVFSRIVRLSYSVTVSVDFWPAYCPRLKKEKTQNFKLVLYDAPCLEGH